MKPCPKNRERLAWLAMGALEIQHEPELRVHLEKCAGCRRYLEEIANVAGRLRQAKPEPGSQPSASFHRNWMGALAKTTPESAGENLLARICGIWNWRLALPAVTAAALVIAGCWLIGSRAYVPAPAPLPDRPVATAALKTNLEPTLSNYEMAVHQSLDKLDELLTEQGNRNPEPSPIYTAARLPNSNLAE
jgi:anti-sigma factor ChrR (cupin superfamily)